MILYHFPTSPFSRRVRLALAHKGLVAELRDARADPAQRAAANRLNPMHTVPVLVDGELVISQSSAILRHLDEKQPSPPLFPSGLAGVKAVEWIAHVDSVITILVDLGLRYAPVHGAPGFAEVRRELGGRAQRTLELLAQELAGSTGWLAGEIAVFTLVAWMESMPARVASFAPAQKMLEVGLTIPEALVRWADGNRARPEVLAL